MTVARLGSGANTLIVCLDVGILGPRSAGRVLDEASDEPRRRAKGRFARRRPQ
jgi:hypothetical protein